MSRCRSGWCSAGRRRSSARPPGAEILLVTEAPRVRAERSAGPGRKRGPGAGISGGRVWLPAGRGAFRAAGGIRGLLVRGYAAPRSGERARTVGQPADPFDLDGDLISVL